MMVERAVLEAAADDWLLYLGGERMLTANTITTYRTDTRFLVGALPSQYSRADLLAAISQRVAPTSGTSHTRRHAYVVLSAFLTWWERNGGQANPMTEMKRPPAPDVHRRPLTVAEDAELGEVIAEATPALGLQLLLMRGLGLRVGDVVGLRVCDLDLAGGRVRCRQGKGGTDVWLPLGAAAASVVSEYLEQREADEPPYGEQWLFPGLRGHITTRAVDKAFRKARGDSLGAVSLHCLRHSFCTDLVNAGEPVHTIQRLMRHSNLSVTAGYMGSNPAAQASAVDKLQLSLLPATAHKAPARPALTDDDLELRLGPAPAPRERPPAAAPVPARPSDVMWQLRNQLGPYVARDDDVIFDGAYGYAEGWLALGARLRDYLSFAPEERDQVRPGPLTYRPAEGGEIVLEGHTYGMLLELIDGYGPKPALRVL